MAAGEPLDEGAHRDDAAFHRAAAALHRSHAGQAHGGARHRPALDLRLDPRGAARPRLRAAREEAADSGGQGPAGDRVPRSVLRQICRIRFHRRSRGEARQGLQQRDRLEGAAARLLARILRGDRRHQGTAHRRRCSTASTSCSGRISSPRARDGVDPRLCPACSNGQLSLKLGKFGAFIGCSNYPECNYTRVLSPTGDRRRRRGAARARRLDPATGEKVTLRNGRFGDYVQQGEGEKPKRSSLPKGLAPDDVTLEKAMELLSLPREVARHPDKRRADPGRHRPLRLLCPARQDLRQSRRATRTCWRSAAIARST